MIRLDLGEEPDVLVTARERGLRAVADLLASPGAADAERISAAITGYNLDQTRRALHARQHGKCAWCERPVGRSGNPIEHVRPKRGARDRDGRLDELHYWWLAWTWTNLVFSCSDCNSPHRKGNKYWMMPGTSRLAAPTPPVNLPLADAHVDVSRERPLLIHPRLDEPLAILAWKPANPREPRPRWRWTLVGIDDDGRGDATIEMLGLRDLEDEVNDHLHRIIMPSCYADIQEDLRDGRAEQARDRWDRLLRDHIDSPRALHRAACWWAVRSLWTSAERRAHGLREPTPPCVRAPR